MKKVYVAGAMNSDNILDMLGNISEGIKIGAKLLAKGYAPFVPHLDILFKLQQGRDYNVPIENYYNYTMEYLRSSDLVVVVPNSENSKGTQAEIAEAKRLGIPVYHYATEEIPNNNKQKGLDKLDFEIINIFRPKDVLKKLTLNELKLIIENGCINNWKAAKLYCNKLGGVLPTMQQLADLASVVYDVENLKPYEDYKSDLSIIKEYEYLIPYNRNYWSSEQYSADRAYIRSFNTDSFYWCHSNKKDHTHIAICIRSKDNR